jgi:hypothetical protein
MTLLGLEWVEESASSFSPPPLPFAVAIVSILLAQ